LIVTLDKLQVDRLKAYRIPAQIVITSCISVGLVLIGLSIYFQYSLGFSPSSLQIVEFTIIFLVTAFLYNVLYFSHYFLHKENTVKLVAERQQREVLEAEMNEFRNDVNPDLLYESLENVINLMYRDVEKAEEYIDSLAGAYRYVLSNRIEELTSVEAELGAARNVIQLLNESYFGQLKFESLLEKTEEHAHLIPGSLPVVIEFIVRNTITSKYEPLIIRCLMEDEEYITLQSKLNDKLIIHQESKLALERLQKSYSLYSDKPLIQVKDLRRKLY
ncbi:MAG: histidine kinase, partial [Bacteroidia bacterium]|nr:histidine kinase [Bacteroidia bacterium]